MKINTEVMTELIVRFIVVAATIIAFGYLLFDVSIFIPTHWAYQFFNAGFTIGIAYSSFFNKKIREGIVMLLLWYLIITLSKPVINYWLFILNGAYISLLAIAVLLCLNITRMFSISNNFFKVVISCIVFGVLNSLVIVVLTAFSHPYSYEGLSVVLLNMYLNLKIGAGLGLLFVLGTEMAELAVKSVVIHKKVSV